MKSRKEVLERVLADIREALCVGDKPLSEFPALIREMRGTLVQIESMDTVIKERRPLHTDASGLVCHEVITEPGASAILARNALSGTTALEKEAMRKECTRLMQWAFTEIRFLCGSSTGLTAGEEMWIRSLAEFAHNLPHLVEHDFSRPYFFFQMDEFKSLMKLYERHREEIIGRRAEGWTKERIYSSLFPQSSTNRTLCEDGQSTGNEGA